MPSWVENPNGGLARVERGRQGGHIVEVQRRRLLTATAELVFEHGVQAVTIAMISARAGVSRKTFYDSFDDREDCLLAAFEQATERAIEAVELAAAGCERWRERIKAGLAGLLAFLDREPAMGRLLIVEALGAGYQTLNARARVLAQIVAVVDQGRGEVKGSREPPPLTAEGVVGAVLSVVHTRMLACPPPGTSGSEIESRYPRALIDLTGALTTMVLQPYLGPAVAERELMRPTPTPMCHAPNLPADPFKDLPIRLTYRTARVLSSIASAPGASSKQVATASGITDEGQTSRLLARLQNAGLIHNVGGKPARGEAKAWTLTQRGQGVLHAVADS
jgi:AcrR family transcriptional regulator